MTYHLNDPDFINNFAKTVDFTEIMNFETPKSCEANLYLATKIPHLLD